MRSESTVVRCSFPLLTQQISRFHDLNNKYGPLVSLKVGASNSIVIAGDGSLVRQILDKRGAIYSGRPLQVAGEIVGDGDYVLCV